MAYLSPTSMADAFAALAGAGTTILAGGTDWFPARGEVLRGDAIRGETILDITRLPGFRGISHGPAGWRIGAATPWADIASASLPPAFDALRAAAREVGSVQIQNAGTIAGNLCNASPAADGVPPLLVLDAAVEIASASGMRRLPLAEFITGPRKTALNSGEIVCAILVPPPPDGARSAFLKAGARRYMVISIAMVAVQVQAEHGRIIQARVAVGACGPVARRLTGLEARLAGQPLATPPRVTADDLSPLSPITDVRGSAAYRLDVVSALIGRAWGQALGPPVTGARDER